MDQKLKILLIEDVVTDAELVQRELQRGGIECKAERVETELELRRALAEFCPELILSDFSLPGFDGMSALKISQEALTDVPFIFVSGSIGEERAIQMLKEGATDYVIKSNLARLPSAARRAIEESRVRAAKREAERNLRESEARFALFMRHMPGAAYIKDNQGRYVFVNETARGVLGRNSQEVIGHTDDELLPPGAAAALRESDARLMSENTSLEVIESLASPEGLRHWLSHKFRIPGPQGGSSFLIAGMSIDVTERVLAEEKVARLNRVYSVLSGINNAIVRIRERVDLFHEVCRIAVDDGEFRMACICLVENGRRTVRPVAWAGDASAAPAEYLFRTTQDGTEADGLVSAALTNGTPAVCQDIETDTRAAKWQQVGRQHGYRSIAVFPLLVADNISGVLILCAGEPGFFDQQERKLLGELAGDISFALEYIDKEEKLNYLAYYDALTGLPNRDLFLEHLKQMTFEAKERGYGAAVAMVDLDRFRYVTNSLGRHKGDALLKAVALRLRQAAGMPQTVARINADTFAIGLQDIRDEAHLAHMMDRVIMACFERPFVIDTHELHITAKAGIALLARDTNGLADVLFANAEAALQKAKASGDKYLFYETQMNSRVAERLTLENKLRRAIDGEQLVLYYQPKVNISTGRISGLEALVRWKDPDSGLVPPGKFIPVMEETGMIIDAGRWALEKAAEDWLLIQSQGLVPPPIAVNVSALQMRQKNFVDTVEKAVHGRGREPVSLDLEITESLIMEDIQSHIPKLNAIREIGAGVAIDDFGTGYSSLSYIARLPVSALKIDRSFIVDMTESPESLNIVSAIISLAHSLNIGVIAEGVEQQEQVKLLTLLRCNEYQGYLYSRPLPLDAILRLLADLQSQPPSSAP